MTHVRTREILLLLPVLLLLTQVFVHAQEDEVFVQYRQKLMSGHGVSMGSIGDVLKNKLPNATEHVAVHARALAEYSKLIEVAFEKNVAAGATDAKPEIWQSWDDYVAKAKALEEAATKLADTAQGGDAQAMMPQVRALGDSCRNCHTSYRKSEEESYKRK
jgi:cytochrome c556